MTIRDIYEKALLRVGTAVADGAYRMDNVRLRRELDDVTADRNETMQQLIQRDETVYGLGEELIRLRNDQRLLNGVRGLLRQAGIKADSEPEGVAIALRDRHIGARAELEAIRQQLKEAGIECGPDGCVEAEGVIELRQERDVWEKGARAAHEENAKLRSDLLISHQCFQAEQAAHRATIANWEKAEAELAECRLKLIDKPMRDVIQKALGEKGE